MGSHVTHKTWAKFSLVTASILHFLPRPLFTGHSWWTASQSDPPVLILLAGYKSAQLTAVQTVFWSFKSINPSPFSPPPVSSSSCLIANVNENQTDLVYLQNIKGILGWTIPLIPLQNSCWSYWKMWWWHFTDEFQFSLNSLQKDCKLFFLLRMSYIQKKFLKYKIKSRTKIMWSEVSVKNEEIKDECHSKDHFPKRNYPESKQSVSPLWPLIFYKVRWIETLWTQAGKYFLSVGFMTIISLKEDPPYIFPPVSWWSYIHCLPSTTRSRRMEVRRAACGVLLVALMVSG